MNQPQAAREDGALAGVWPQERLRRERPDISTNPNRGMHARRPDASVYHLAPTPVPCEDEEVSADDA